jgi:hypothetical protein
MPVFQARVVNLIGWGEQTSNRKGGGWTRNKIRLSLGPYQVTITQLRSGMPQQNAQVRGRMVDSSRINIKGVQTYEEGVQVVTDLCWLWSFAIECRVLPYWYKFGNKITGHNVNGRCNTWRPPFGNGVGTASDFVTQAWASYRAIGKARGISGLIDMLSYSVMPESTIESQATASVQCLESIKSYFAICEGKRFGVKEEPNGSFTKANGKPASFEYLLKLTLKDVGMQLPPTFDRIKRLRNAIIHRGYIRETDNVTKYIFGPLTPGAMHTAMFETVEAAQDILREFVRRILGYKGDYWLYSHSGSVSAKIT